MASNHPDELWSPGHHWHLVGASAQQVYLSCCSCDYSIIIDSPGDTSFLRFSLMEGPSLVGQGRGFLRGSCAAGERLLTIDGYEAGSCSNVEGRELSPESKLGVEGMGIVRWLRWPQ